MAERQDLEFTYSLIDRIFRLSLGEQADFSGAKYDGDFTLSLEEAQRRKHEYIAEQIKKSPTFAKALADKSPRQTRRSFSRCCITFWPTRSSFRRRVGRSS